MHPLDPETNRAALEDRPVRNSDFSTDEHNETAPNLRAFRLVSKFGFAFETAVTISQLAWGICK